MEILTIFLLLLILLLFGGKVAMLSGKVNRLEEAVRRLQVERASDEKTVDAACSGALQACRLCASTACTHPISHA